MSALFVDRPIGIDLGTTNSEVAILDPSERDLLVYADRFGRKTVPSAVAWDPEASALLVGRPARARRGRSPAPIESIKRKMGQTSAVSLGEGAPELTPEQVSAAILGELRTMMREHLVNGAPEGVDVRVRRAVITVPAYFDAPQVEATRRAGELAELEVLGVLQEPTAAAIYQTWKHRLGDGNFLVYDLGGGTFDVSVLRCLAGEYQVLAIDGDNFLGGDDFDRRFAEHLRRRLVAKGYALELDVAGDPEDAARFQRLVHLSQEIKESLSTAPVVPVAKSEVLRDRNLEVVGFEEEIGRDEYEAAIADLLETTLTCCERALERSREVGGVGLGDIDQVILVGGSTRVPAVVRAVMERLCAPAGLEAPRQDEVDTCVALGAAVHAAQLGGLRLGTEAPGGRAQVSFRTPLVARGAELKLDLEVEEAPDGTRAVAIVDDEGELAAADVESVPSERLRLEVELGEEAEQPVRLELLGGGEKALATLPFALYRGDVRPRASGLSKPSVVAKDIALEVLRAGRRERKVLVPRGVGLPYEAEHRFFTADRSGAVVLRLLQNRLPIKTLVVDVPAETDVGSPVDLTLRCDEAMRLEARARVAGQELWAQIEPAQLDVPRDAEAVEALLARAEDIAKGLWGREAAHYRREHEPLATGLREVLGTDPDKALALTARLQLLVNEFEDATGDGLAPPLHRFEAVLDALRRVVYRTAGPMLGMDPDAWDARIQGLQARGQEAWDERDASTWRRLYNEAQALFETASEQEFASRGIDDPATLERRLAGCVAWSGQLKRELTDFVPSQTAEVRALQLAERDRLLASLEERVLTPLDSLGSGMSPAALRQGLDRLRAELERIESGTERLPQIGLVSER
ncbi:MAG: Hsp70 family protein [Myxococcota bacterium]